MSIIRFIQRFIGTITIIGLMLGVSITSAQEVTVKAELDTNRALIGDQLKLHLSVEKPADLRIDFPVLRDTITDKIEIVGDPFTDTATVSQGRVVIQRELLITVFDTGLFEIPSLYFHTQKGQSLDSIPTLPLFFEILAVKTDSTLRDIKGNFKAPLNLGEIYAYIKEYYPYGLLVIAAGILFWLILRYIRKKLGKGRVAIRETPAELPEIAALRELEKLKADKLWLQNKVKLYYIRLSEILRNYIEDRFNIMAPEQTTDEILQALHSSWCPVSDQKRLTDLLKLSDLVKFAKVIPGEEENAVQVDQAVEFVQNTSNRTEVDPRGSDLMKNVMQSKITIENV
jgi:hypothetical protein